MARYKRYHPVSHNFNHDPEVMVLRKRFGLSGYVMWIEMLAILDRTENQLKVNSEWVEHICKLSSCRITKGIEILSYMIEKQWLEPNIPFQSGMEIIYKARKYWEYHKIPSGNKDQLESLSDRSSVPPKQPPLPTSPNLNKQKEL